MSRSGPTCPTRRSPTGFEQRIAAFAPGFRELVLARRPLRGLYLAGSSVHPGGGVHGVSGHAAARSLLADASPLRFWR